MTDKVSLEVEAYNSGYLLKVLRDQGEEVPVTEVIAYIGEKDEKTEETTKTVPPAQQTSASPEAASPVSQSVSVSNDNFKDIKISPLAKNIASSKGVDISKVSGTGPGGRIVKEDIENYIIQLAAQPAIQSTGPGGSNERIKISPLARILQKSLGSILCKLKARALKAGLLKRT